MKLLFVVQGLFEKSDSIGFDCFYQYELLKSHFGGAGDVRLFAERADAARYPTAVIQPIGELYQYEADPDVVVIYHFCDGWPDVEARLERFAGRIIIRWHNNTPPWFYTLYSRRSVMRTVAGFKVIQKLGRTGKFLFMCNSNFTRNQLAVLGVSHGHLPTVYPASRYLDGRYSRTKRRTGRVADNADIHLLFVGRLVAHKGHRHILLTAYELKKMAGRNVIVSLPGRADDGARGYAKELRELAEALEIELRIPGEVDADQLEDLYRECSAFVCMSEHEGFGLPVYEAMARDVPTVVWSNTAFSEILDGHPLASGRLNYTAFATAIHSLQFPDILDGVLKYQRQHVLPEYTKDVVLSQLLRAIAAARTEDAVPGASRTAAKVPQDIPFEIQNNYVTQYDITSYAALANETHVGEWESQSLSSNIFSSPKGPITAAPYTCTAIVSGPHVVFGPFLTLPAGSYRIIFDTTYRDGKITPGSGFRFDAFAKKSLVFERVSAEALAIGEGCMLEFTVEAPVSALEFRIQPYGFPDVNSGELTFWGVRLTNISVSSRAARRYKDDQEFVESCYERLLGRPADGLGLGSYLLRLKSGVMNRADVVAHIMESEEGQARRHRPA
jgi:glycosyltransferase involved in cell wall biosynthesis